MTNSLNCGSRIADCGLKDRRRSRISSIGNSQSAIRNRRNGFTLIELLLVMVILAILAAVVVPKLAGRTEDARIKATTAEISNIQSSLRTFEIDNGRYPTTEEGLKALVEKPADLPNWKSYLDKVPQDQWQHDYIYRCPGTGSKDFDLFSCGPDGREGSADDIAP